tara:strand:+ start:73 stop:309 length:237 start_codon:yes stop_codon:yes gene_type:complete
MEQLVLPPTNPPDEGGQIPGGGEGGEGQQRGQLSPKNNEDIPKEPVSLSFNKTAFSLKHEECIREALARSKFQHFWIN